MIKNILIDLDDTILDFKKAERIAVAKTLREFGLEPTDEVLDRYHVLNKEQWEALERGEITRDIVKVRRYANLFNEFGIEEDPKEAAKRYEKNLGIGHYFLPGSEEFLRKAKTETDLKLYLVSNGTADVQDSRIASAGIAPYFDGIYISEKIGLNKPSKAFFDYVFEDIRSKQSSVESNSFSLDETLIVGDSLTSDILGGINAGIKTVWFNPEPLKNPFLKSEPNSEPIVPDFEIRSLDKIFEISQGNP